MDVYISSTFSDLAEHRVAVYESLQRIQLSPGVALEVVRSEDLFAGNAPSLTSLLKLVRESSIYILLLGWRYGYVPEGQSKSVVELEYEEAKQHRCVELCFVIDEKAPVPGALVETGENAAALRRFKARVLAENLVRRFSEPRQLADDVGAAVALYLNRPFAEVGQDIVDRPLLQQELQQLRQEREQHLETIDALRRRFAEVVPAVPIWRARRFEADSTLCFCLMPFQECFFRVYEEGVLPAIEAAGLRGIHAGQIFDNREIMEDIWESICTARVVVADVTDRNPNVFYELGICHTLGKEVIVITQRAADVPFDIRHRRFIEYAPDKMAVLRSRLQQTIQRVLVRSSHGDEMGT